MSRAFVNEDNAAAQADQPVERRVSEQPNYVTTAGLEQLHARVAQLQAQYTEQSSRGDQADKQRQADIERDLRYFNQRLQSAQVVAAHPGGKWVETEEISLAWLNKPFINRCPPPPSSPHPKA